MKVELPRVFSELLTKKARYKLYYGGRAGGKSYAFVDALLIKSTSKKMLIACVREVQSSIKDSVYKLIADRIAYYGLSEYRLYEDRIVNVNNNSKFIFKGIMDYNAQNIKSLEGVDICWCEEAQKISKRAWEILDPTIRKPGAEIWISLNREEEEDPVWKAIGERGDEDVVVKKVNYYDNPYCPEDMKKLALKLKKDNYSEYLHIWEGEPRNEASNNLIARKDVYKAIDNRINVGVSALVIGVDVARFGDDEPYHFYVEDNNKYVFQIDAEQVDYGSFTDLLLKGTNFAIEHEEGFDYSLTDKQRANFMDRQIYMAKKKIESAALNELWVFVERVLGTSDYKKYWKKTEMPVSLLNIYKGLEVNQNEDVETIQFGEIDFDLLLKDINQKYSNIENDDDNYIRRTMLWQLQGLKSGYMRKILAEARMNTGLIDVGMPWSGYFTQGKASELALVKHREHNNYLSRNPYFSDSKGYVQILSDQGVGVLDAISYDDDTEMKFKKDEELIKHVWASVANGAYDFSDNVIHLFENADVETIIHESFHYFNNFLKNPQFRNNFVLEGDYYDVLDGIKEDISLKYKVLKSDGRFFVVNKETGEIMPEVQRAFNSADEAIDTAAEEVFVSRMVKLFYGKRTLGRDIASAANLYRTWLNKLTAGIGVTSKTSGEGGKEVLKFFRNKIK